MDVNGDDCIRGGCERRIGGVVDSAVKDNDAWDKAVLACLAANAVDRFCEAGFMGSLILCVVNVPFDDGAMDKRHKTVADLCLSSALSLASPSSSLLKHPYLN